MTLGRYTIGLDLGTLSGRAVLVDVENGAELASSAYAYPHGVLRQALPDGTPLGIDWALAVPGDYVEAVSHTVSTVLSQAGVLPQEVIGLGVDCTASTLLPVRRDGTPLCALPAYRNHPHAYAKLWKHHACQSQASRITEAALSQNAPWLAYYGGKISAEWTLPKVWELLEDAPEIYHGADLLVDAGDWVVWQLTGRLCRSAAVAGYKAGYDPRKGNPDRAFLRSLDEGLEGLFDNKMGGLVLPVGERAGEITEAAGRWTGLRPGTAVAVAQIDAHATLPAVGITQPGHLLAILGTSTCHVMLGETKKPVPGICGVVEGGIYPGLFAYEAGQSCVGDGFDWVVSNCVPPAYLREAEARSMGIHALLRAKAEVLQPGESGLVALDWWNGNRSVLVDADLSGLLVGLSLSTRPEEIYRALIEGTAFGTRKILEAFQEAGVPVHAVYASGGIAHKDPMTMQIYADVLGLPVHIAGSAYGSALGSAIYGAVAAGGARGGYETLQEAAAMGRVRPQPYLPQAQHRAAYDGLYQEYCLLHDFFGRDNGCMKRLKQLKKNAKEQAHGATQASRV